MFILSRLSDLIRIPPDQFNKEAQTSIIYELNKKYANKVVHNLGLIISVWDLIKVDDGLIKPGDGSSFIKCEIRVVVFRPFVGEILTGWIEKCSPEGLFIKCEFFNDIFIPKNMLFPDCEYNINENAWIWKPDEETNLYLDINEKIKFRVEEEIFINVKPKGPKLENETEPTPEEEANKKPSYAILGSCQTDGMGCVSWWE
ncbi:hypothetical protein WICMUC_000821 [Wickerhamomyces mucosus]|uniref:DNA-directed RNA polymerase subunit n=1 Tax=Wickerhamomyces mucosus TaxID=1378264 RepID=A0A9P8TI46_9ASCO|nr:hypothetical protein WICMUC_000821 [Wickerhamomyces mucosus]